MWQYKMRVCIRTDASAIIGSGHVMRCIALAERLRTQGADVKFVCREFPGDYVGKLQEKGFAVERLSSKSERLPRDDGRYARWLGVDWETDAQETRTLLESSSPVDWLVVDHYAIDRRWEKHLRGVTRSLLTIDDLADRFHDCDILLDQNRIGENGQPYGHLVPAGCRILLGPTYALLRKEFAEKRMQLPHQGKGRIQILVFWGGVDQSNETAKTLAALDGIDAGKVSISVVVGRNNPHKSSLEEICRGMEGVALHFDTEEMANLIFEADLAIGAPGVSSLERCCLGVPTVMASVAENQVIVAKSLNAKDAGVFLGPAHMLTSAALRDSILGLINDERRRQALSQNAMNLVDGLGAGRVVEAMFTLQ